MAFTDNSQKEYRRAQHHCLVIAIDEYEDDQISNLDNCVRDATAIMDLLVNKYQFDAAHTTLLTNKAANRKNIYQALKQLKKDAKPKDNVVVIFSGHGIVAHDIGHWLPVDAIPGEEFDFIPASDLINIFNTISCHHFIADCRRLLLRENFCERYQRRFHTERSLAGRRKISFPTWLFCQP